MISNFERRSSQRKERNNTFNQQNERKESCSKELDLFALINHADPTNVRIGEKQIEEGQVPLLESTRGRVVPLAGGWEDHRHPVMPMLVQLGKSLVVTSRFADSPTLATEVGVTKLHLLFLFVSSFHAPIPDMRAGGRYHGSIFSHLIERGADSRNPS
ncbi:hypothetical protein Tco_1383497 [Tanacetum coccineum]